MKIHEIVARLNKMNLSEQVAFLRGELRKERLHSVRHNEIRSLLEGKVTKLLRRESRAA